MTERAGKRMRRVRVERDDGSVLILVLVLMVIGSLIILPLMTYGTSVLRANRVEARKTREVQSASAGIRLWLSDPGDIFNRCNNNATFNPGVQVNGNDLTVSCTEVAELGPADVFGFQVPYGAMATQLGEVVRPSLSAPRLNAEQPYPDISTEPWWGTDVSYGAAQTGKVWLPDLPNAYNVGTDALARRDSISGGTGFAMPGAFNCTVYLPGYYPEPVTITTGNVYFASGLYYFEDTVTIGGDADVVVGQGLADFDSGCADDIQVSANLISPPPVWALDSGTGGGTWIFGDDGHLVVNNSTTASGSQVRLRFNQRYAATNDGGWTSIMTVNGDDDTSDDHLVTNVNNVPRSAVIKAPATDVDGDPDNEPLWERKPIGTAGALYNPSNETYTDEARLPTAPGSLMATPLLAGPGATQGAVLLRWNEVAGQDAGGALLDGYTVAVSPSAGSACVPTDLVVAALPSPGGNQVACLVRDLTVGTAYTFAVNADNEVGAGPATSIGATPSVGSALIAPPAAPTNVSVVAGADPGIAQVSWDAPTSNGGSPVSEYEVTVSRVFLQDHANVAPVAAPVGSEHVDVVQPLPLEAPNTVTGRVRAYDPNGDDLSLTIDTAGLPAGLTAVANDADDTITVTATDVVPPARYTVPYTVTDAEGLFATGVMAVDVVLPPDLFPHLPEADVFALLADVGSPMTVRVPVADPDGVPFAAVPIAVDTSGLDADWTVAVSGTDVTVTTTAPDGTYQIPYTFTDASGSTADSTIDVTVTRGVQPVGSCQVVSALGVPLTTACEIPGLVDLAPSVPDTGHEGYRFDVTATNALGVSASASNGTPLPIGFTGGGDPLLTPPVRVVEPWIPEPVIDIDTTLGAGSVVVEVEGYVSVPMGRIRLNNPSGQNIEMRGGVVSGTYDIDDSRADDLIEGSLPIGYAPDIVLQRRVRLTASVGGATSVAIVEINKDATSYGVNSLVTQ